MLRRFAVLAFVTVNVMSAVPATANRKATVKHVPGCNTTACDGRIRRHLERWRRLHPPAVRWHESKTSDYNDAGETACETHYSLGFAHLGPGEGPYAGMACGTRVRFCAARCATGTMQDHGPYIFSREFDLNAGLRAAIGAPTDVMVRWHVVR